MGYEDCYTSHRKVGIHSVTQCSHFHTPRIVLQKQYFIIATTNAVPLPMYCKNNTLSQVQTQIQYSLSCTVKTILYHQYNNKYSTPRIAINTCNDAFHKDSS